MTINNKWPPPLLLLLLVAALTTATLLTTFTCVDAHLITTSPALEYRGGRAAGSLLPVAGADNWLLPAEVQGGCGRGADKFMGSVDVAAQKAEACGIFTLTWRLLGGTEGKEEEIEFTMQGRGVGW